MQKLSDEDLIILTHQVGDIVKVENHDEIPCDLVIISSSNEEGKCHIMTANLDGETNTKVGIFILINITTVDNHHS